MLWGNMEPSLKHHFERIPLHHDTVLLNSEYDYCSLMHSTNSANGKVRTGWEESDKMSQE